MGKIAKIIEGNVGCKPAFLSGVYNTYGEDKAEQEILDEIEKIIPSKFQKGVMYKTGWDMCICEIKERFRKLRGEK